MGTLVGTYVEQPCERCGSKKHVSKTWMETVENSYGKSQIEVSQITCTNPECQKEFDKNRKEELERINERKVKKEEQDLIRKANILKTVANNRKQKEAKKLK